MKKSEFLKFQNLESPKGIKTMRVDVISVQSNKSLGLISWYPNWRQYVFYPNACTVWNHGCLDQIKRELVRMNHERAMQRADEKSHGGLRA